MLVVLALPGIHALDEDLPGLHRRIERLCQERCAHYYQDEVMCSLAKGKRGKERREEEKRRGKTHKKKKKKKKKKTLLTPALDGFCHWTAHLALDNHLQLIQDELKRVAPFEKNDMEDALRWAVEDIVNEKHKEKKGDDHAVALELQDKLVEVVTGILAFYREL
jgi:hypothetical protein